MSNVTKSSNLSEEQLSEMIREIRGQRVILDRNLAAIYGVETKALNRAVKRNSARFPEDFMFQLSREEAEVLRYQFGTLKRGRGQHRNIHPTPSPNSGH
jgi:hypothetical protein